VEAKLNATPLNRFRQLVRLATANSSAAASACALLATHLDELPCKPAAPAAEILRIRPNTDGDCALCGKPYDVNESVMWLRGVGAWHLDCDDGLK